MTYSSFRVDITIGTSRCLQKGREEQRLTYGHVTTQIAVSLNVSQTLRQVGAGRRQSVQHQIPSHLHMKLKKNKLINEGG